MSVSLVDRPTITIQPPADPDLAKLWDLAAAKFEARTGGPPAIKDEWNQVTRDYNALTLKARGPLSQIMRERCEQVPGGD
jgi:hypothetical protein